MLGGEKPRQFADQHQLSTILGTCRQPPVPDERTAGNLEHLDLIHGETTTHLCALLYRAETRKPSSSRNTKYTQTRTTEMRRARNNIHRLLFSTPPWGFRGLPAACPWGIGCAATATCECTHRGTHACTEGRRSVLGERKETVGSLVL